MILAASIDSTLIYLIVIAAIGAWKWISERMSKNKPPTDGEDDTTTPHPPQRQQQPLPESGSEQDRMRRFLEALGLPSNPQQQQPPAAPPPPPPPPPRPAPAKHVVPTFAPRPISMPVPRPMQHPMQHPAQRPAQRPVMPPVRPRPAPVVILEEPEFESLEPGRLEEPAAAVDQIAREFELLHRTPAVGPFEPRLARPPAGPAEIRQPSVATKSVLEMLRSPQDLRTALIVRELLGPPLCLQK